MVPFTIKTSAIPFPLESMSSTFYLDGLKVPLRLEPTTRKTRNIIFMFLFHTTLSENQAIVFQNVASYPWGYKSAR